MPKKIFSKISLLCIIIIILTENIYSADNRDSLHVTLDNNTYNLYYYSNYSLENSNENISRVIIVFHGTNRNADTYFEYVRDAAIMAGNYEDSTVIIAPYFMIPDDDPPENFLYWNFNSGWKKGDKSSSSLNNRISAFALVDTILERISQNYNNLTNIVIAGHSAGGQFVNRYAAGSQMENKIRDNFGINIHYIIANPSSYLYFDNKRRVEGTIDSFEVPTGISCLSYYNEYKYGLDDLNNYMESTGVSKIKSQYKQRNVIYLLGVDDRDPNSSSLDKSCPGMLQGNHRLERGKIYHNYIGSFFGDEIYTRHKKVFVFGVGHSSRGMFQSNEGIEYLFNYQTITNIKNDNPNVEDFILNQNYPNPFNGTTNITFNIAQKSYISLSIYNSLGQRIRTIVNTQLGKGNHKYSWDGKNDSGRKMASGIYFMELSSMKNVSTKKLLLLE